MIEIVFNCTLSIPTEDKDTFIRDFNTFLDSKNAQIKGVISVDEFEDAEIVND